MPWRAAGRRKGAGRPARRRPVAVLALFLSSVLLSSVPLLSAALRSSTADAGERIAFAPRQNLQIFFAGSCAEAPALLVEAPAAFFSAPAFEVAIREAGRILEKRCPRIEAAIVAGFDRLTGERLVGGIARRAEMWSFEDRPEYAIGLERPGRDIDAFLLGRDSPWSARLPRLADLPPDEARFYSEIANLAWIAVTPAAGRQIYVVASPWDAGSLALYRAIAAGAGRGVAWRWILLDPRNERETRLARWAVADGGKRALDAIYLNPAEPPVDTDRDLAGRRLLEYHYHTIASMKLELDHRAGRPWGYPTLVFVRDGRVRVLAGVPQDFDSLVAGLAPRPAQREMTPAAREIFLQGYEERPLSRGLNVFAVRDVEVRAMPHLLGRTVMRLKKTQGYPVAITVTTGGRDWYGLEIYGAGKGYGYVPADAGMLSGGD